MDKLLKPWTTLSPAPPKFQSCFLLPRVETGGQNKSNPTAWHVTHALFKFLTFGEGGVQYFPRGLNILSIYGREQNAHFESPARNWTPSIQTMTMGYPDTFTETFYESGCIIQQCCIIAPLFDTSPAIPPDKCLVVCSTSLSCPCRQASNAVGPTITVTNRGCFVGWVNSTLFSTSVFGFWGREFFAAEWKQWWNGKTLFSCMFIFSRDFSHPRQKISD